MRKVEKVASLFTAIVIFSYRAIIERLIHEVGDGPVEQVPPEQILTFLNRLTEGNQTPPAWSAAAFSYLRQSFWSAD